MHSGLVDHKSLDQSDAIGLQEHMPVRRRPVDMAGFDRRSATERQRLSRTGGMRKHGVQCRDRPRLALLFETTMDGHHLDRVRKTPGRVVFEPMPSTCLVIPSRGLPMLFDHLGLFVVKFGQLVSRPALHVK